MVTIEDCSELDKILKQIHSDEFKPLDLQKQHKITSAVLLGFILVLVRYTNSGSRKAHHEGNSEVMHLGVDLCQESSPSISNVLGLSHVLYRYQIFV